MSKKSTRNASRRRRLPAPALAGDTSVEEAIASRRSEREFTDETLSLEHIAQLCWAAQGLTEPSEGLRAVPSAGALYPIELYIATAEGLERYLPAAHALTRHVDGDLRPGLRRAALDQAAIAEAPVCMVITAVISRAARKYGERADMYCLLEAGHVAQNVLLQAATLRCAGVPIGAFEDDKVHAVLQIPERERVLYLIPLGRPSS